MKQPNDRDLALTRRLQALQQLNIMDSEPEQAFDDITAIAASTLGMPIALISLLDDSRQWFKSKVGLDVCETPIGSVFCAHAILSDALMEVSDAREDARFAENPLVLGEPHIRFYAGVPLSSPGGTRLGTLCVIDSNPRQLDNSQRQLLTSLARLIEQLLLLRHEIRSSEEYQRELVKQQSINRQLLDSVVEGVVTCDAEGALTLFNNTAQQWHGANIIDLAPDQWASYYHLFDADGTTPLLVEHIPLLRALRGETVRNVGMCIQAAGQPPRFIEANGGQLSTPQGQLIGAVVVMHDVTERRRMDLLKRNFVASVSHELRTPLTSISGAISLVQSGTTGPLSAAAEEMLGIAQLNSKRLNQMINDLLDIERLESGQMHLISRVQPLLPIIRTACEINQSYATEFSVSLELDEPAADHEVIIDANRILQVMDNYLSNAIKFSPAASKVVVQVELLPDRIQVNVVDQGSGIAEKDQPRLFQRFSQLESASRRSGGTGLGLSITRELITRMGGETGVVSIPGQGARFWFSLPLAEATTDSPVH
jgi:signal transduction histidine kinase